MTHRPYLPVELVLPDHPKTQALAKIWGCHPYTVVGFLVKLWGYCLEFQDDGNVDGRPADVLDILAAPCVATSIGTLPTVRQALQRAGFVDDDGTLHDWWDYAGALIERRRKDRRRKQLARKPVPEERRRTSEGHPPERRGTSAPRVEKSRVEQSKQLQQQPLPLDYATRCCLAVNRVLEQQLAGAFSPLVANVERPTARAWESAGIPIELAEQVLAELSGRFPSDRGRQPKTLGYFTAALHEAHAKQQAAGGPAATEPDYLRMRRAAEAERQREQEAGR